MLPLNKQAIKKIFTSYILSIMQLLRDKKRVARNPLKENYVIKLDNKTKKVKRDLPQKEYININWKFIDEETLYNNYYK